MKKDLIEIENEEGIQYFESFELKTDSQQGLLRIDKFLMSKLERITRNKLQNAIKAGCVKVNDEVVKSNYKVRPHDQIVALIPKHPLAAQGVIPEDIPLDIVYEDSSLMVINKPTGLVVHPGIGNYTGTLVNGLAHYFLNNPLPDKDKEFMDRPGIVHRIDKDTSGLLLIAKTDYAMSHLAKQFYDHSIDRTYQALCWSEPAELEGTINEPLGRDPSNRLLMGVREDGKHAITHYKTLETFYYVTLIQCKLETGRTHQIRAHFAHLGCPLFGDERYGGTKIVKGTVYSKYKQFVINTFKVMPRQALHAKTLGFTHPETGERMSFDSALPEDFQNCIDRWRKYLNTRKELMDNG